MEQDNRNETEIVEETEATETVEAGEETNPSAFEQYSREELVTMLGKLAAENEENRGRYLRAQADFDNFRRRSRQEKEEFAAYANTKIIEELLPVLDIFNMALKSSADTDTKMLLQGIEMVHRQFIGVLEKEGLQPIDAIGQTFDPNVHEAVMNIESDQPANTVVEELRKGYRLKEKVIRPAMVKVSQ